MACPARGQVDEGNIRIHRQQRRRYHCTVCGKTCSDRVGTVFFRRRTDPAIITQVLTLVSHGCPIPAIEAAFGLQAATIRAWVAAAGQHAQAIHHAIVAQPQDLAHVQADEIRVQTQAGMVWMALALMVRTRLWLGGAVSPQRERQLLARVVALVVACAQMQPLLFVTDGLTTSIDVVRKAFRVRQAIPRGRPRWQAWPNLVIAQVVKRSAGMLGAGMQHRLIHGTVRPFLTLLWHTPGCQVLNTASIERLNGTFRSRLAALGRRTHWSARCLTTVVKGMYLIGTVDTFCTVHTRLRQALGRLCTPAMAAGMTDHVWSVAERL